MEALSFPINILRKAVVMVTSRSTSWKMIIAMETKPIKSRRAHQHWQRKSQRHIHVCIKLCHNLQCLNQVSSCKESKQSPLDPSCGLNCDHTSGCISDIGNAERCWHSARKAFFQQYFRRSSSYSSIICITFMESKNKNFYIFYVARLFYIVYTSGPGLLWGKTFNTIKKTCFLW